MLGVDKLYLYLWAPSDRHLSSLAQLQPPAFGLLRRVGTGMPLLAVASHARHKWPRAVRRGEPCSVRKKLLTLLLAGDAASSPRISGSSFIDVHM